MKFEVINSNSTTVMQTETWACIPDEDTLKSMAKAGYKFKLDGKAITTKKLNEKLEETNNGNN